MQARESCGVVLAAALFFSSAGMARSLPRGTGGQRDEPALVVRVNDEVISYREMGVFVMPGARVQLQALGAATERAQLEPGQGSVVVVGPNKWSWVAPAQPGLYRLKISRRGGDGSVQLNVFVMVPGSRVKAGILNGYRIGAYPAGVFRNNTIYKAPPGFIEVTKENADTKVSPHFELKQFLCKQSDAYPKYVVLNERLLLKLEGILERLNELGYDADGLHVMSGYRTPFYNKTIGNVKFSAHQYGGAGDVFVDEDKNGIMDDLNKDKKIDRQDAILFYTIADQMSRSPNYGLQGGLGHYAGTKAHGPFVHVDVRGNAARWSN